MKRREMDQKIEAVSVYICKNRVGTSDSSFVKANNMEARIAAVKRGEVFNAERK